MTLGRVVVTGASLAGLRCVEQLRRRGFDGSVTLIGAEAHAPYDRPPLSKQLLAGTWDTDKVTLCSEEGLAELDVDARLGHRAAALDLAGQAVVLETGQRVDYDALVIATGAAARVMPGTPPLEGIHVLRTLDDSLAIRAAMEDGRPAVVVIGAGFIGSEVAATARGRGLDVTVLEALPVPLSRGLGPALGAVCGELHRDHGVDLRCSVEVAGFEGHERVAAVVLSDGTSLPADLVVVGVGASPATDWLDGSGLQVYDGVVCDETLLAHGTTNVWAAGDVARWHHRLFDEHVRIEHWTNAADQGAAVARNLLAGPELATPFADVPYVWSHQYETRIQIVGRCRADDEVTVVQGTVEDRRFVALYGHGGHLSGAIGFNLPKALMACNRLVAERTPYEEAVALSRA